MCSTQITKQLLVRSASSETLCSGSFSLTWKLQVSHDDNPQPQREALRKSVSLHQVNEVPAKYDGGLVHYKNIWPITNERLTALIQNILLMLATLEIQDAPTGVIAYKTLFVNQFLDICALVLYKIIKVDYGDKRDEMISSILQVSKILECPVRVSKLILINPLSSSAIKTCTLFLHWLCTRVIAFHNPPVEPVERIEKLDEKTKAFLHVCHERFPEALKTGKLVLSEAQAASSIARGAGLPSSDSHASEDDDDDDVELERENHELEERLTALWKKNEETRKRIAEYENKPAPAPVDSCVLEAKQQELHLLREKIAALRAEQNGSGSGDDSIRSEDEPTESSLEPSPDTDDNNNEEHAANRLRLEELQAEYDDMILQLYKLYEEIRNLLLNVDMDIHAFSELPLSDFNPKKFSKTKFIIWLDAMEAFLSSTEASVLTRQVWDYRLKNRVVLDQLARQYGVTPDEVIGSKAKVNQLIKRRMEQQIRHEEEKDELKEKLDLINFKINELNLANQSKEARFYDETVTPYVMKRLNRR